MRKPGSHELSFTNNVTIPLIISSCLIMSSGGRAIVLSAFLQTSRCDVTTQTMIITVERGLCVCVVVCVRPCQHCCLSAHCIIELGGGDWD